MMTPNRFAHVIADIFDRHDDRPLTVDEERALIVLAKDGDQDATVRLLYGYARALRNSLYEYMRATKTHRDPTEVEDARMAVVTGFLETVQEIDLDTHERLATIIRDRLARAVEAITEAASATFVPSRTLRRFYGILREADGDEDAALQLAPTRGMRAETFLSVLASVRHTKPISATDGGDDDDPNGGEYARADEIVWLDPQDDADDRMMVDLVFARRGDADDLTAREEAVLRYAYGFESYGDPQPDSAVGYYLGVTRSVVRRARANGLDKARGRLGVRSASRNA